LAYGADDDDFSPFANLADVRLKTIEHHGWGLPIGAIAPWRLADDRFDDQHRVSAPVGSYHPNAWRLYDMHGNVAEWTRSSDRAYPYRSDDDRNDAAGNARRIVRGGSWYDRPKHARSARRVSYQPYQRIYDVGFRVVLESS
jgi:formylglycine-generating enzyme required for sulfatase activity